MNHPRLRLVTKTPTPRRTCEVCEVSLHGRPFHHRLCLTCYRWTRLGAALREASRWLAEPGRARP